MNNVTRLDDERIFREFRERIAELRATGVDVELLHITVKLKSDIDSQVLLIPAEAA